MEARELRIGNYISRHDLGDGSERVERILELGQIVVTTGPIKVICDYEDIKPIQLTPEWLERFGFHKKPPAFDNSLNPYWAKDAIILLFTETPPNNTYLPCIGFIHEGKHLVAHRRRWITSVHELQNIFYSITGKELELKS